jgi:CheY-like chemotaxis protein
MQHSILIIDDSEIDTIIAEHILLRSGKTGDVIKKPTAHEALDYLDELERNNLLFPDVILLDINMPQLSGFEFVQLFTTYHPAVIEKTCIYLLTSSNSIEDKKRAEHEPCIRGYFEKPLTMQKVNDIFHHSLRHCA